jgi:hypothetical protein
VGLTDKDTQVLRARASRSEAQGQATFGMANLRHKTAGLPFVVFISQKDEARHAARVKVSPEPRVRPHVMSSYRFLPSNGTKGPVYRTPRKNCSGVVSI